MTTSANDTVIDGQKRALELAVDGAPLAAVLEQLVRTLEAQSSNNVLGSILLLDGEHLRQGAAPSLPPAYNAAIDGIAIGPHVGSCGTAAFTASTVVVGDIATDPLWKDFKDLALRHELRACWSTPIFSSKHEVLGTFAMYHRTPMTPSERDREIVALLGHTAGIIIERDRNARDREAADAKLRAALEQQTRRLGVLFEHAPAAIAVVRGPEHRFEIANAAYAQLVGGRDVVGKTLYEALPELEGQGFDKLLDGVRATNTAHVGRAQRVVLKRGGELVEAYVDFVYQPLPGPDDQPDSVLAVAFEVTELVRAQQELRTLIDHLPTLAWTARPDGYIDYYNQRWYEYTGTTFEEMQGWGWEKVHDPARLADVTARWKHSLATGESFEMEFTLRGADGIPRWFLTRVAPVRDANGAITRWIGTNTNIDDIKAAQALSDAFAQQSLDVQQTILQLRDDKQRLEQRLAELERQA